MTKFTSYYNLCPIHDPKEFLGISPDRDEGNIITTLNKNIVIIIKISTQKQIRSWSVSEKLSTKVVFDVHSQRYVGVFGHRSIRCWDEGCEDVNRCKKLKFKKFIADIVVVEDNTFLVYSDGSCEMLAKAIESRKDQVDEGQNLNLPTNRILDAKIFKLTNGKEVLTCFERKNPDEEIFLVLSYIENGIGTHSERFKVARRSQPDYEFKLVGYAVVESDDTLALMSIWSDNSIYMLKLDGSVAAISSPGKYVASMSSLRVDCQMAVLGISRNFVAIYGANNGQEGASLLLYNTKFQVIKTKQYFKVYLDYSRLWTIAQYILLAMGQNLTVVSYSKSPDLIADLLGTQTNNNFDNEIERDFISEEEALQENIHYADGDENEIVVKQYGNENKPSSASTDDDFADGNKIPFEGLNGFDEALHLLNSLDISMDIVKVNDELDDVRIAVMSDCNDTGFVTPEVETIAQKLENCGASEWEITEKLLTLFFRANLLTDIVICLRRYTNVSDKMLVNVLKYALGNASSKNELPKSIGHVLAAVFACKFNSDSIAVYLRREIDHDSTIRLMRFLYDLLEKCDDDSNYCTRPSAKGTISDVLQYEMQIINWFSVLLSSHFQKLVLSKDVNLIELLFKWHQLCERYKSLMGDLQETAALLYNIVAKKKAVKQKTSSWYTIEEVYLW